MRIGIDARIPDDRSGGVKQVIIGLASGLGSLDDSNDEYVFVTYAGLDAWLQPLISGNCSIQSVPAPQTAASGLKSVLERIPLFARLAQKMYHAMRANARILPSPSSGIFEQIGADIVHFPLQAAELVQIPNIYHPHDLQHVHYPEYFTAYERNKRDVTYRAYARNATKIAVVSNWIKQDLIENLDCPADKIAVVPLAPPNATRAYVQESSAAPLDLPGEFFFYPAQTWPHKNHATLIEALALLHKRKGERQHLVLTGAQTPYRRILDAQIARLNLDGYVHFLGFVSPAQLQHIYRHCIACVIPSLFEAASFPAWEAFFAGAPVAAARVTSLPDQIGDAGLLFAPRDTQDLSDILERLAYDPALRKELAQRGHARVNALSWQRTARHFRALYRAIAGAALSPEDRTFLDAPRGT